VGPCQTECLPSLDPPIDSSWVPRLGWSIRACTPGEPALAGSERGGARGLESRRDLEHGADVAAGS